MVTKKTGRRNKLEPGKGDQPITNFFPRTKRIPAAVKRDQDLRRIHYHLEHGDPDDGFEVTTFPEKGRGVITTKCFKKGDFVVEYAGELLTHKEAMVSVFHVEYLRSLILYSRKEKKNMRKRVGVVICISLNTMAVNGVSMQPNQTRH